MPDNSDLFYPTINERDLHLIARIYTANPHYFDVPECPYSEATKEIFKGTSQYRDFDTHKTTEIPATDSLIAQINILSHQLQEYGNSINLGDNVSASDRNTYFRLSVALLEKLIEIKEKVTKIKEYEVFTAAVMDIMDKLLSPDQRNVMMAKLGELSGVKEEEHVG